MKKMILARILIAGLLCAFLAGGCKKKTTGDPLNQDLLAGRPDSLDYIDFPGMNPDRFTTGTPVEGDYRPIYFAYDSSRVPSEERVKAEVVAQKMGEVGDAVLIVEGNCDERGSREYNLALGERRALAVRAYLIGLGIDSARIQTKSFGEESPVALGHDEASWRANRRGEFRLYN